MFEDDLKTARRRAERAITEDGFLDIRNIKLPKPLIADHFDDEVRGETFYKKQKKSFRRLLGLREKLAIASHSPFRLISLMHTNGTGNAFERITVSAGGWW